MRATQLQVGGNMASSPMSKDDVADAVREHLTRIGRAETLAQKYQVIRAVYAAWMRYPEMRLGQLMAGWMLDQLASGDSGITAEHRAMGVMFHIEDGDLAHNITLWTQHRPGQPERLPQDDE